ncbi:MAG: protein Mettu [Gammaproteobacteria bacterium]|nr:protein Mettu [Gammaproteobacteria bacterium]
MNDHWYRWQGDVLLIQLHLCPRAKHDAINGLLNNRLRIRLKSPPVDGKANKQLLELLANEFGTSKTAIEIVSGKQGRNKRVAIHSPKSMPDWFHALTRTDNTP